MHDVIGVGPFGFVVLAFAVFRLAHIIPRDVIADGVRAVLYRWAWRDEELVPDPRDPAGEHGALHYVVRSLDEPVPRAGAWRTYVNALLTCVHCTAFWLAPPAWAVWRWAGDAGRSLLLVIAVAGAASLIEFAERD